MENRNTYINFKTMILCFQIKSLKNVADFFSLNFAKKIDQVYFSF